MSNKYAKVMLKIPETRHPPLNVPALEALTHIFIGVVGGRQGSTPFASQNLGMLFIMCVMIPTCKVVVETCGNMWKPCHEDLAGQLG